MVLAFIVKRSVLPTWRQTYHVTSIGSFDGSVNHFTIGVIQKIKLAIFFVHSVHAISSRIQGNHFSSVLGDQPLASDGNAGLQAESLLIRNLEKG